MEDYLLKSNILLVVFYALFYALRKHELNHQLNRFVGWACIIFSTGIIFIPLGNFFGSPLETTRIYTVLSGALELNNNFSAIKADNSISIFFMIYLIGIGVFSIRSLIGLATLSNFFFKSEKYCRWGFKVVALDRNTSPFTFFNILFIGNQGLECDDVQVMIEHEQVHRDQFHSVDALILEMLTIMFWFNPAIWLFQRDIRAGHEYLADEQILKKGFNMLGYQQLLFQMRTGTTAQLVNYLSSKTSLKKRFNMMTKQNNNTKTSYFRAFLLLPIMAMVMILSSFSEGYIIEPDTPAVYNEGVAAMYKTIGDNIKYPLSARKENRSGTAYVSFDVNKNGDIENVIAKRKKGNLLEKMVVVGYYKSTEEKKDINDAVKSESIRVVKGLGKFVPAQKNSKPVGSVMVLPIEFLLK